ncbi:Phage P2 GpU [compost metagenome]
MALPSMGAIGDIGFISYFGPERKKVRTFKDFVRTSADRWGSTEIILQKPRKQFLGPGLDTVSFTIVLDANLGMNPRPEMEKLLVYSRDGKVLSVVIGGKPLGQGKWSISGLTQNWTNVDNKGNVLQASLDVSLEEYV